MSFESRFAAFGRAIDDMLDALRHRVPRSRPSRGPGAAMSAIAERLAAAIARTRSSIADRTSPLSTVSRRRFGVAMLILISIALSTVITRQLAGGGAVPADATAAQSLRALAASRDQHASRVGVPLPMRSTRDPGR